MVADYYENVPKYGIISLVFKFTNGAILTHFT